ncbi:MAG: VWA domain-containing protein [Chloroflexota bacterium]
MKIKTLAFLIILGLILHPVPLALSQAAGGEIRINLVSTLETPDAMILKLYFNLYDESTGTPILSLDAKNAQITLLNTGYAAPAQIKQPDIPIYITLLMDSSGSMGGSAGKLQEAAKLALNNTPDNALFAVVQFDEQIKLLQDFTENIPAVSYAIDQYKVSNLGTCLYDATYMAIEAQAKAPAGRRAVILFTDGKDENRNGKQCSQHSYQDLIALAMQMQVPVHTVGLSTESAKINDLELKSMAASTGGFSFVANEADLAQAFARIMEALKAQWMVETNVYPKNGQNEAVFSLALADGRTMNSAFSFTSETDYPGPPSPVRVQFAGLQLVAETQSYDVQLTMASPELVSYVKISIWDQEAGSKVDEYIFEDPATFNTFNFPAAKMAAEGKYELRIIAVGEDSMPFAISEDDQGKALTELVHEFVFDPTSVYASATIDSVAQDGGDLVLNVSLTNANLIGSFDGWLVNEDTNTQVPNSTFTSPAIAGNSGQIVVPAGNGFISAGKYTVVLRVIGKNGQVFTSTQYPEIVYKVNTASLTIVSVEQEDGDLVLNVSVSNPELIGGFDGWLVNKETNTQVPNSNFTSDTLAGTDGQIIIPTNSRRIPNGKYTVIVRVLAPDNEVLMATQYEEVTYKAPTIFQRLGVALVAAPIFLALIIGIVLALMAYLMISSSRQKSLSGTPVMQGRLGGKLKSKGGEGIVAAIADEEPLPSKRRAAVSPRVAPSGVAAAYPAAGASQESMDRTFVGSESMGAQNGQATLIGQVQPARPRLTVLKGPLLGERTIDAFPFIIGRGEDCSFTIADPNVSRRHLQINYDAARQAYNITDLNSSNGTRLNGQRLAGGQPTALSHGATIDLGNHVSVRFDL